MVCERLGLDSINIDTSSEYIALSEARLVEDEQKRIDEQIKQLRREAKAAEKSNNRPIDNPPPGVLSSYQSSLS